MIRTCLVAFVLVMSILVPGCAKAKESKAQAAIKGKFVYLSRKPKQHYSWLCVIKDGRVKELVENVGVPCWSFDGKYIISSTKDAIIFLDEEGKEIRHIEIETPRGPLDVVQSPSGDKIAYTFSEEIAYAKWIYHIYIYNSATDTHQKIATFNGSILTLAFSPQGDRLLCDVDSTTKGKDEGIYILNLDGSNLKLINSAEGTEPSWFPDGKHIGLMSNYGENMRELVPQDEFGLGYVKLNLETGERKTLRERYGWIEAAKISRDGKYLYYSTGSQIVVSPIDNLNEEIPITHPAEGQQDKWPDWYQGD